MRYSSAAKINFYALITLLIAEITFSKHESTHSATDSIKQQ